LSHPILERLDSAKAEQRRNACLEAATDPSAVLLLDALARALGDPDKRVAQAASDSLAKLAATCPEVADVVRNAMRTDNARQRWNAAFTCSRIEPVAPRLLPALVEALGSDEGDVRWAAARLLVNTGRAHGEVLPLVLGLAKTDPNPTLRSMALYCLRELAPDEPGCARVIVAATRDPVRSVKHAALTALAALHDADDAVVDRLIEVSVDGADPSSQRIATFALGALGARPKIELPTRAIDCLRQLAHSGAPSEVRTAAQRAITACGSAR